MWFSAPYAALSVVTHTALVAIFCPGQVARTLSRGRMVDVHCPNACLALVTLTVSLFNKDCSAFASILTGLVRSGPCRRRELDVEGAPVCRLSKPHDLTSPDLTCTRQVWGFLLGRREEGRSRSVCGLGFALLVPEFFFFKQRATGASAPLHKWHVCDFVQSKWPSEPWSMASAPEHNWHCYG